VATSTNQVNYHTEHEKIVVGAGDILSYFDMSDAAPGLVSSPVPHHHAQRIFLPYVLGLASKSSGLSVPNTYLIAGVLMLGAALFFFVRCTELAELREDTRFLMILLVVLNPYLFRHLIMFNGYINDIGFLAGISVIMYGVLVPNRWIVLFGLTFAALSRQTTLLVIPGVILMELARQRSWRPTPYLMMVLYFVVPTAVYLGTDFVAKQTGEPSETKDALFGLFIWMRDSFSAVRLLDFGARGFIPFTFTLAMIVGFRAKISDGGAKRNFGWALLFMAASICVQPILGGPDWTTDNIPRLNAFAVFPAVLAAGILVDHRVGRLSASGLLTVGACLSLGSIHHVYAFNGVFETDKNAWFAAVHLLSAMAVGLVIRTSVPAAGPGDCLPQPLTAIASTGLADRVSDQSSHAAP
jgi:hypothetical protein